MKPNIQNPTTREDYLALADALERHASRRGSSGVDDRLKALECREKAAKLPKFRTVKFDPSRMEYSL